MIDLDKLLLIQNTLKQPRFKHWDYTLIPGRDTHYCVINTRATFISGDDLTLLTFELGNPLSLDYNNDALKITYEIKKEDTPNQTAPMDPVREPHVR